jgi:hypothetical protein
MTRGARQSARQGIDVFLVIPPCMEHTKCRAGLRRIKIGVEVVITPPQSAILRSSHRRIGGRRLTADWKHATFPYTEGNGVSNLALRGIFLALRVSSKIRMISNDPASF